MATENPKEQNAPEQAYALTSSAEDAPIAALEEEGAPYQADDGGFEVIKRAVKTLPDRPGVYRMIGSDGEVLYVGKARSLRKRVASYTKPKGHTNRILRMIMSTASMVFVTTATETEALLLEANLIKQLKPRFNVILRDDKSFPHIVIKAGEFPKLAKHRGAKNKEDRYFGPFASAGAVNRTLDQLQKAFLLRDCADASFANRTRPCLQYQIKRCAGPCVGLVDREGYAELVENAVEFLSGKTTKVQAELAEEMRKAAENLAFERAGALRDRIRALTQVQQRQDINPEGVSEADVIALYSDGGQTCIEVFFFRAGQNWGNRAYFPKAMRDCEDAEILSAFIGQFYANKTPPRQLLLSMSPPDSDLIAEALSEIAGRKVEILAPQRGEKRNLVDHALTNAREALARRTSESVAQGRLLAGVAEAFGLEEAPRRIEVYDNSHIQGAHAVGAFIVAGPTGFDKSQYRKFNIKNADLTPGDDFGMMREVLTRRFKRLIEGVEESDGTDEDETPDWPDLILIDGGAGQLTAALDTFKEMGGAETLKGVTIASVAKGEERDAGREVFHMPDRQPFALPFRDPTLYFLQRLRDEAHRFAIGAHRQKRAKAATATSLDDIPGVGASRKRAILAHFGSAKAASRAGLADLEAVEGVSKKLAKAIYDHFNGDGDS